MLSDPPPTRSLTREDVKRWFAMEFPEIKYELVEDFTNHVLNIYITPFENHQAVYDFFINRIPAIFGLQIIKGVENEN